MSFPSNDGHESASARQRRRAHVRRRFFGHLAACLNQIPGVKVVGEDALFLHLAVKAGLTERNLASHQLMTDLGPLTVIGVANEAWFEVTAMGELRKAMKDFARLGRRYVLVPQRMLKNGSDAGMSEVQQLLSSLISAELLYPAHDTRRLDRLRGPLKGAPGHAMPPP